MPKKTYKVHSLERGLDLLEFLAEKPFEKTMTELSRSAGFTLSTTHRILGALKSRGYVEQKDNKYKLSLKVFVLGNAGVRAVNVREEAMPILTHLARVTGESAYLIVLHEDEALCIERIDGNHPVQSLYLQVGRRMPLHVGAGPKVILAHLPDEEIDRIIEVRGLPAWTLNSITNASLLKKVLAEVREKGYALSFEDATEGIAAIGCPVRNWTGEVIAAISISGFSRHFNKSQIKKLIRIVVDAARELSSKLGFPAEGR